MENYFGSNIRVLREKKNRSQQELADFIGIKRSILNNYEHNTSNPSIKNLRVISEYFNISIDTLLSIDFSKLSNSQLSELEKGYDVYVKGSKIRVLATTVNEKNQDNVEMVSAKAKAGYAAGYGDSEFISKLPSYHFPFVKKDRKHRAFQISGDSMPPVRDKSWILGEYLEDWNQIKDGKAYIIVTRDEGIVFKLAYNRIKENGKLLLTSLNPAYKPYELNIADVVEIWKYAMRFSEELKEEI